MQVAIMAVSNWKFLPTGCLVVGLALVAGCRSAPQPVTATPTSTSIPPLFGSPVSCPQFALSNEAMSPTPLELPPAPAAEPAPKEPTLPPTAVAQPDPMMSAAPNLFPPQSPTAVIPAQSSSAPPSLAQQPTLAPQLMPPSAGPQHPQQWAPTSCLPESTAGNHSQQLQSNDVQSRLLAIEQELNIARNEMKSVNGELKLSQGRISDLNNDLARWKQETKRLESEMKSQQQSDLKALDELATAVSALIDRQRSAQASNTDSTHGGMTK